MSESIFEQIDERTISFWVNAAAAAWLAAAVLAGACIGRARGRAARGLALGILWGALGPIVCLYWHLYDARTSYWDWVYLEKNPDTYVRFFWIGRPTPAARAEAARREAAGEKGVIIVKGTYDPARFWRFVQPYPLYSVRGLGLFALATLAGAVVLGVIAGLILRAIDRRWPIAPETPGAGEPEPLESAETPAGDEDAGGADA